MNIEMVVRNPGRGERIISCRHGATLRTVLIDNQLNPNRGVSCSGLGVCGTCVVTLIEGDEKREVRACQIRCFRPMEIELVSPQ